MKSILVTAALVLVTTMAFAQKGSDRNPPRPATGVGSKTMESCRADTQKYCATASSAILKECLVRNWDRISNDCQDAVGMPGRGQAGAAE